MVGTKVLVHYPDYVSGLQGKLIAREDSDRWIVKLKKNSIDRSETLLLSLETSDFQVID